MQGGRGDGGERRSTSNHTFLQYSVVKAKHSPPLLLKEKDRNKLTRGVEALHLRCN